jgi:L-asparaginase II
MVAQTWRNGVVESTDLVDAVAIDPTGAVIAAWGDVDRVCYYRSAIKPIQATVAQQSGAAMSPEQMALATGSHSGFPIHLALVRSMLTEVGLDEHALQTTPGWPIEAAARDLLIAAGHVAPRSLYHNCSGKHAAFLRACVASGWPIETHLDPDHPLQIAIGDRIAEASSVEGRPPGVDGCGAPAYRGSLAGLARVFARVSGDPEHAEAATAMSRFPSLVSGPGRPDGILGRWWAAPLKVGAQGILGAGRRGIGIAVKSRAGSGAIATMGMIEAMRTLDLLSDAAIAGLADIARPPVLGGGRIQGSIEIEGNRQP